MPAPLAPLNAEERDVIRRVVDSAPPLSPTVSAELATLLGGVK